MRMFKHLYIHVPFCHSKCHYCGFYSVQAEPALVSIYPGLIATELSQLGSFLDARGASLQLTGVQTLYCGGGTPAVLGPEGFRALREQLGAWLDFSALREWTVELNPSCVTQPLLETLAAIGVTRLSLGAQSFCDATLQRIGRSHTAEDCVSAVRLAQRAGFGNVGVDLIAGLPGVSSDAWRVTLDQALSLDLVHLSVYGLSIEPGTRLAHGVDAGEWTPLCDDAMADELDVARCCLEDAGYAQYEISNFAVPGFACEHNLGVWRGNDYLGLGPAAASRLNQWRWTNDAALSGYIQGILEGDHPPRSVDALTAQDDASERAVFRLRLNEGFDPFSGPEGFSAQADQWEAKLEKYARVGLVERGGLRWRLTARGREVCDGIVRELLV